MGRAGLHAETGGFVLVCVLWILAILTVVAVGFGQRSLLDARASVYSMDHAKAMMMARGAVQRGAVELRNKQVIDWYNEEDGGTGLGQAWANPDDMLVEGIYYGLGQSDFGDVSEAFEEEVCFYIIEDEERRISINTAPEELLQELEALRATDVNDIMDRRPHRTRGGREREEQAQPFFSIEELRYMFKIDDEEWFGEDGEPGLRDLVTCWGGGRANINTASEAVLASIPDLREGAIGAILTYRAGLDGELATDDDLAFAALEEVVAQCQLSGKASEALHKYCAVHSQFFTITGVATLRRGKVRAVCKATVRGPWVIQWREEPLGA